MEILFQSLGPGVHCYSPFLKPPKHKFELSLEELCKNVILKCVTLRRLSLAVMQLPLPNRLLNFLTELSTTDFEKIECAPFSDAFSFNFLHRALTYRVVCLRDGQEYMITYGYSPVEELKLKTDHQKWVKVQHKNVMCICATITDPSTQNTFYVYDQPCVSLEQMWNVFCSRNQDIPDIFFWRLTADICEALQYMQSNGLYYGHFELDNIFIVGDRLVLENGLMRKHVKNSSSNISKKHMDHQNVLSDIEYLLKHLQSYDAKFSHSDSLRKLISHVEKEKSLDIVLQIVNNTVKNLETFSFMKLIQSLQK